MNKDIEGVLKKARGGLDVVAEDWMPLSRIRPFVFNDPAVLWLEFHGDGDGFQPDSTPFDFLDFYNKKSRQFERRWLEEVAPQAVTVCQEPYQVIYAEKARETIKRMLQGAPVIARPALWWSPERIYGVPDLIVHTSWLSKTFPNLLSEAESQIAAPGLGDAGKNGHYVVVDLKFTTDLDNPDKKKDKENYGTQSRLATYILGQLQGFMPAHAFLITRDRLKNPLPVGILSQLGQPLEAELAALRDKFVEIKVNGAQYKPWKDPIVANNPKNNDERWRTAKERIALELTPGGDPRLLYKVGDRQRDDLNQLGFPNLEALLKEDPAQIPLTKVYRIGKTTAPLLRAILQANRSGSPVVLQPDVVPRQGVNAPPFEFYVDFEYFNNLNVDFDKQWPGLEGHEMIFMIGVGWDQGGEFNFESRYAKTETQAGEQELLEWFLEILNQKTGGTYTDQTQTALYHWSPAENWQALRAADRQIWGKQHPLRNLPWVDLQTIFKEIQAGIPGAWGFGLKEVAKALGKHDAQFDPHWVGDLDNGLSASVLGWKIYSGDKSFKKDGFDILTEYLRADCKALWQVLRWLRSIQPGTPLTGAGGPSRSWEAIKKEQEIKVKPAFVAQNKEKGEEKGVIVYLHPGAGGKTGKIPINHLIWGDRLDILGEQGKWCKIRGRNTTGWVHQSRITSQTLLEVNFIDVGQGDGCFIVTPAGKYILIDAGVSDHMVRFLHWYFAHFKNKVEFQAAIISHPDEDHYGGFRQFFRDDPAVRNLSFKRLYHNGILDAETEDRFHQGVISDWPTLQKSLESTAKGNQYFQLLRAAWKSKRIGQIDMLWAEKAKEVYLDGYGVNDPIQIRVLAPVPTVSGDPLSLPWFSDKGPTKNGNSIVLRLHYGNISILLGGDLNTKAEEHLLAHYGKKAEIFRCQIAKACHHGSCDFTSEFLEGIDAIATVVSSGDDETYCHPRPDSLGALGRYSQAKRPLIFSTELARSAPEKIKQALELEKAWWQAQVEERQAEFVEDLIQRLGRTVAVYGMIALRTDGKDVLFAQKLERAPSPGKKWDLHLLSPDLQGQLTYMSSSE